MTFERLRPKSDADVPTLIDVLESLTRNSRLIRSHIEGDAGIFQIYWLGHCFGLVSIEQFEQLKSAVEFELMCWGANERCLYFVKGKRS